MRTRLLLPHEDALVIAARELESGGWVDLEAYKIGIIEVEANLNDEVVKTANEEGFSATIYAEAEN